MYIIRGVSRIRSSVLVLSKRYKVSVLQMSRCNIVTTSLQLCCSYYYTFRLFLKSHVKSQLVIGRAAGETGEILEYNQFLSRPQINVCCPTMSLLQCRSRMAFPYSKVLCPEPKPLPWNIKIFQNGIKISAHHSNCSFLTRPERGLQLRKKTKHEIISVQF